MTLINKHTKFFVTAGNQEGFRLGILEQQIINEWNEGSYTQAGACHKPLYARTREHSGVELPTPEISQILETYPQIITDLF